MINNPNDKEGSFIRYLRTVGFFNFCLFYIYVFGCAASSLLCRLFSSCSARVSHCCVSSLVAEGRLSNCSSRALEHITLPTKVCRVKAMVFPVVMYGHESWTIKKAEHQRIDAFGLWCCRRLLRVPWTARRPNQSILKEISPEYSLEGLMLKQKLQCFGRLIWRADFFERWWC